jgi:tRNA dimethylallyltransferase
VEPLRVLVGPTGSGKSAAAIPLARALDAEIVSLDSMLLYRGMDIGTDKPRDQGGVPHHLVDCLDPREPFHLADYLRAADRAIEGIRGRGRRVLVVGGTGLYLMGLLRGIFEGPPPDPLLRARIEAMPPEALVRRVAEVDPETSRRLHPHDRRRQRRALEVYEQTGVPVSRLQTQFAGPDRHPAILAGIRLPRDLLRERIRRRIDAMFARGLVDEVRRLDLGPTAAQAVGYKEVLAHLRGEIDLAEARRLVERHTLRLVRRQATWFRRFDVTWVDGGREDLVPRLLDVYLGRTTE